MLIHTPQISVVYTIIIFNGSSITIHSLAKHANDIFQDLMIESTSLTVRLSSVSQRSSKLKATLNAMDYKKAKTGTAKHLCAEFINHFRGQLLGRDVSPTG